MVQATALTRNEDGIGLALGILKQQFGERFQTGASIREQHAHTTTWIMNQPPDGVVFAQSTLWHDERQRAEFGSCAAEW